MQERNKQVGANRPHADINHKQDFQRQAMADSAEPETKKSQWTEEDTKRLREIFEQSLRESKSHIVPFPEDSSENQDR